MATYWENSCSFGLRYVSWYKYLIVSLVFSHLGFWSGNLFLIAPFPDLCLLVPSYRRRHQCKSSDFFRRILVCVPCKSDSLARLIARSSEFIRMSAPIFVQSTLESVQRGCHDNALGELIPDVYNAVDEAVCPNI